MNNLGGTAGARTIQIPAEVLQSYLAATLYHTCLVVTLVRL